MFNLRQHANGKPCAARKLRHCHSRLQAKGPDLMADGDLKDIFTTFAKFMRVLFKGGGCHRPQSSFPSIAIRGAPLQARVIV